MGSPMAQSRVTARRSRAKFTTSGFAVLRRGLAALLAVTVGSAPLLAGANPTETGTVTSAAADAAPSLPPARFELPGPDGEPDAAAKKGAAKLEAEARVLTFKNDCNAALPLFESSYKLGANEAALAGALSCREKRGEFLHAHDIAAQLVRVSKEGSKLRAQREAKLAEIAAKTAILRITRTEHRVKLELDGETLATERGRDVLVRVLPGAHSLEATKERFQPFKTTVTAEAGKSTDVPVTLVPIALPPTPAVDRKQVLDFCYMAPKKGALGRSQKQRLVMFKLAGRDVANGPEKELNEKGKEIEGVQHYVLRDLDIHDHLRSAFVPSFVMERFYTVEAAVESPKAIERRSTLTHAEMIDAAGVDSFAAYSLACTDWVVLPRVVGKDASWQKVKTKKKVNGKEVESFVWHLKVNWKLEADIYRHEESGFQLADTIEAENGGLFDLAVTLTSLAPQKDGISSPLLSKRPQPGCNPPLLPELASFAEGVSECADSIEWLGKRAARLLAEEDAEAKEAAEKAAKEATEEANEAAAKAAEAAASDAKREGDETIEKVKPSEVKDLKGSPAVNVLKDAGKRAGASEAATAVAKDAAEASGAADTVKAAAAAISAEERAALSALASLDPSAVKRVGELAATAKHSGVIELAARIKKGVASCKKPVDAVKAASDKLHTLSQQGPAALGVSSAVGLASCVGVDLAPDLSMATAPGQQQQQSRYCHNVINDASRGSEAMRSVGTCTGRVSMERATLLLQKEAKGTDGFRLHATLLDIPGKSPDLYGIGLGKAEGVHRGDMFVAMVKLNGEFVPGSFGRIQYEGPGGNFGDGAPSHFKFRNGTADPGTRMEEHAQIGVPLGLRPLVKYFVFKGDLDTTLAYGGAIEGGYNASRYVSVADEVWGRANVSFAVGSENETFLNAEIGPEVVRYLGGGLAAFGGSGIDLAYAMKKVGSENLSAINYGVLVNLGLDYAIRPDWDARLSVAYRQGLGASTLRNDSETLSVDGGSLSAAQAGVSAGYTF